MDEAVERKRRSRSEPLRDAGLRYLEQRAWSQVLQYGEQRARARNIRPEDVAPLVDEYRSEKRKRRDLGALREVGAICTGQSP